MGGCSCDRGPRHMGKHLLSLIGLSHHLPSHGVQGLCFTRDQTVCGQLTAPQSSIKTKVTWNYLTFFFFLKVNWVLNLSFLRALAFTLYHTYAKRNTFNDRKIKGYFKNVVIGAGEKDKQLRACIYCSCRRSRFSYLCSHDHLVSMGTRHMHDIYAYRQNTHLHKIIFLKPACLKKKEYDRYMLQKYFLSNS